MDPNGFWNHTAVKYSNNHAPPPAGNHWLSSDLPRDASALIMTFALTWPMTLTLTFTSSQVFPSFSLADLETEKDVRAVVTDLVNYIVSSVFSFSRLWKFCGKF